MQIHVLVLQISLEEVARILLPDSGFSERCADHMKNYSLLTFYTGVDARVRVSRKRGIMVTLVPCQDSGEE